MKTDLKTIPGVGPNMERHFLDLGISSVEELKGRDPEELYFLDCARYPGGVDRCCLYVYRLAVVFAEGRITDPEQRKWWNWKDDKGGERP